MNKKKTYTNPERKILELLKRHRQAREFSQDYMAAKMGLSQSAYSKLETGQVELSLQNLVHILHLLDLSFFQLAYCVDQSFNSCEHIRTSQCPFYKIISALRTAPIAIQAIYTALNSTQNIQNSYK